MSRVRHLRLELNLELYLQDFYLADLQPLTWADLTLTNDRLLGQLGSPVPGRQGPFTRGHNSAYSLHVDSLLMSVASLSIYKQESVFLRMPSMYCTGPPKKRICDLMKCLNLLLKPRYATLPTHAADMFMFYITGLPTRGICFHFFACFLPGPSKAFAQ